MQKHDRMSEAAGKTRGHGHFANQGDAGKRDEPLLPTPTGREDGAMLDRPNEVEGEARSIDVEARPASEVTANPDPEAPEETAEGLDETAEAVRRSAEERRVPPSR
ncbi:MAG: hypothetical protein AB7P02_31075 [Alphaproteobacteria bacterium]